MLLACTGTAQYYHPIHCRRPLPTPLIPPPPRLIVIVTTCLYISALFRTEPTRCFYPYNTGSPRQDELFFLPAFVAQKMTPRSRKSGYGLLLGCRSGLDGGPFEKLFSDDVRKKNWPKTGKIFTVCFGLLVRHRNRSGVVDLVGREPLMFAKVENGVTKLCQNFRRKNRKNAILAA